MGKDRSRLFKPAVDTYAERLGHYCRFSFSELPEGRTRADEAGRLLKLLGPKDRLVALDEGGIAMTSVDLSRLVTTAQNGSQDLLFVIGGDEGLDEAITSRAHTLLSLSRLTLPHRLARLVLVEQIYRAFTLVRGEPYHRP